MAYANIGDFCRSLDSMCLARPNEIAVNNVKQSILVKCQSDDKERARTFCMSELPHGWSYEVKDFSPRKSETVNHPSHYGGDTQFEVIKVLEHWLTREEFIGAMKFQIFKYTPRAGKKNPGTEIQDHEKSIWYQNYLVDYLRRHPI